MNREDELQGIIDFQAKEIKELLIEIDKRLAKPLFGEARSLLLKAMDNSANVDDAIDKYKGLKERIKELEGDKEHPENYCHLCGGKNISWYVDNELWNEVTKSEVIPGGICCPLCFVKLAEKKGIKPTAWRLSREGDSPREIELQLRVVNRDEQIEELEVIVIPISKTKKNWEYYADEVGIALCCSDCPGRCTGKIMTVGDIRKLSKP